MSTDPKGHDPSALDKWLLVRYKKFPSKEQIPKSVSAIMMRTVHDKARVHFSLGVMAVSAVALFANAVLSKRKVRQGDSLDKRMQKYQDDYNKRKEEELSHIK